MSTVAVIDYGMGNLHSMAKALARVSPAGMRVELAAEPAAVAAAERVVFPGVGAMRDCMAELRGRGLVEALRAAAGTRPLLGVCVGMQALLDSSEENEGVDCLGLLPGSVRRFSPPPAHGGQRLKVPHMGWNQVRRRVEHPLWTDIEQDARFYFVHSYYAVPEDPALTLATTDYPGPFASAIGRGSLFAVQFHPEKSQRVGLQLLANFLRWDGS